MIGTKPTCDPHRLRPRLRRLAARPRDAWTPNPLLPQPASPEHLWCVLLLDRAPGNPGLREASTAPARLSNASIFPTRAPKTQNENWCTTRSAVLAETAARRHPGSGNAEQSIRSMRIYSI